MTIAKPFQQYKRQDCAESDAVRVVSGVTIRRFIYFVYLCLIAASAGVLSLFPSTVIITGFVVLQVLLLATLYPLVKFAIRTEDHDLVWDRDGIHWSSEIDIVPPTNEYSEQIDNYLPPPVNSHLSYGFI